MSKQDRQGVRTPADIEQKYNFGKSFAEVMGIATDARQAVDDVTARVESAETSMNRNSEEITMVAKKVTEVESNLAESIGSVSGSVAALSQEVSANMTAEGVDLKIQSALQNGTSKVVTETGFTFDEEGLTVSKSGSEMETQITENGMTVSQNDEEVLTANNAGVDAKNLHATTYLIVGKNSRFEDMGDDRTGCFWIGG